MRNESKWSIEFYNSCPVVHEEYDQLCEELKNSMLKQLSATQHENKNDCELVNLVYGNKQIKMKTANPEITIHKLRTTHQKDDRSCGSFISFYVYARMNGMTPDQMQSELISMDLIQEFRKMMVADLGDDEKFYWKGLKYTISNDEPDPADDEDIPIEELEALRQDIEEFDEYMLQM